MNFSASFGTERFAVSGWYHGLASVHDQPLVDRARTSRTRWLREVYKVAPSLLAWRSGFQTERGSLARKFENVKTDWHVFSLFKKISVKFKLTTFIANLSAINQY